MSLTRAFSSVVMPAKAGIHVYFLFCHVQSRGYPGSGQVAGPGHDDSRVA